MSNELPVIGSFGLREDFWDRHGAKIATRLKVIYGAFWKLYDTLIIPTWLKFISDFVIFHNQTTCMRHVFYRPIYGTVPRAYNGTLSVFLSKKPRVVSGS